MPPCFDSPRRGPAALPDQLPDATPGFDAARLSLLLDPGSWVASFQFSLPQPGSMAAIKAAGLMVTTTATNVAEARALVASGADAVIAQGCGAGGHRGAHRLTRAGDGIGALALVPQMADAFPAPVIAAGGIGDARGIAMALALGAAGVQMGAAFLLCPEAATEPARRVHVAASDGSDAVITAASSGHPTRARRTAHSDHMAPLGGRLPPFPTLYGPSGPVVAGDLPGGRGPGGVRALWPSGGAGAGGARGGARGAAQARNRRASGPPRAGRQRPALNAPLCSLSRLAPIYGRTRRRGPAR